MNQMTESQRKKIEEIEAGGVAVELKDVNEEGIAIVQLSDGSSVQLGRRGGVTEVGNDPRTPEPEQTPAPPAEAGGGEVTGADAPGADGAAAPQPEPPAQDELTAAAIEQAEKEAAAEPVEGEVVGPVEDAGTDDPADFMPPPEALEVAGPEDAFRAFDRADEVAILEQLQGQMLESYVYSFEQGGKKMTDLSVIGVNECVRLLNNTGKAAIQISTDTAPEVTEFSEGNVAYVRVMVAAKDPFQGRAQWGMATEPKHMTPKSGKNAGKTVWDKFAATKALSKAQRNALKQFIPEEFRRTMIAQFLGQGKVRQLAPVGAGNLPELPPPLTDDKAEAMRAEIRELYRQLREVNPLAMVPGQFNAMLTRSEWSHERLEEFREHVSGLLEKQQKAQEEGTDA